jgi:hypothetical protein
MSVLFLDKVKKFQELKKGAEKHQYQARDEQPIGDHAMAAQF